MLYDAIVVGSGPGGAIAASVLASRKKSVLLVDRQSFPRDKVCGDGLPIRVMAMLRELNVDIQGLEYQRIKALSITGPAGQTLVTYEESQDQFSMTSRRYSFDNTLHQHAVKSGAKFEVMHVQAPLLDPSGEKVIGVVERKGKTTVEHEAKIVIAADGAASPIARALNKQSANQPDRVTAADDTAVAIRAYAKLKQPMPPCVYFYFNKSLLPGYAWIFPIADGYANIGVYVDNRTFRAGSRSLVDLLAEFQATLPPKFAVDLDMQVAQTWPLPIWTTWKNRTVKGVLFVGDAGRFINAITGGGIYPAMMTGLYAAQHALDLLDSTRHYPDFDTAWRPEIGTSLRNARILQHRVAPYPFLFNSLFSITNFPPIKATMLRTLSGEHY
ncbi:MAG: geranylgeranyl reductase family protein [Chloroflexota bacterium]